MCSNFILTTSMCYFHTQKQTHTRKESELALGFLALQSFLSIRPPLPTLLMCFVTIEA